MIADRVRMRKVKNREVGIEVMIHSLNFEYLKIYVGDGTVDPVGNPDTQDGEHWTLVHTTNGD
jgi:hypothetical protein